VNVGDDWGLETLAWTKMSYRPVRMLQKFVLRKAGVASVALTPGPAVPVPNAIESTPAPAAPAETTVRPALKDDVAAAVELEQACFAGNTFSLTKRQLQYLQRRPSAVFLVAEQGGRVVGEGISLVRQHKKGLSGRVYSLAVSGTHRGQKIGQKLLSSMVDALAARGVARVYLEVEEGNGPAVALYERFGFRRIGSLPDYYGAGKAGLHMMYEVPAEARVGEKLVRT
jgi:ribosomal-protein-alanine N-acetyltransferase